MAETIKPPTQVNPGAASLTDGYTVPALTTAVISSIVICNRSAVSTTFRISHAVAGAADDAKQYLYYDQVIGGLDTFIATIGATCGAADVIRVYATLATLTFNIYKTEIS